jgi:hypothetical protein
MKDRDRVWSIRSLTYYAGHRNGKMQTTGNHYAATAMTQNLAEQVGVKLIASGLEATVCDLFADPDTLIHETLADIGEEAPPLVAPPTSLAGLAKAIELCFDQGFSPVEVLNHCNKIVLG